MPLISKNLSKIIVLASLTILVLASAAIFLYLKIQSETGSLDSQLAKIAVLEKRERDFSGARQSLSDFSGEISVLKKSFLSEKEFVDFIKILESTGQKAGVKFKAQSATLSGSPAGAGINFTVDGDFVSVAKFFVLLDNLQYSGILNGVFISPITDNSKMVRATANYIIFNFTKI